MTTVSKSRSGLSEFKSIIKDAQSQASIKGAAVSSTEAKKALKSLDSSSASDKAKLNAVQDLLQKAESGKVKLDPGAEQALRGFVDRHGGDSPAPQGNRPNNALNSQLRARLGDVGKQAGSADALVNRAETRLTELLQGAKGGSASKADVQEVGQWLDQAGKVTLAAENAVRALQKGGGVSRTDMQQVESWLAQSSDVLSDVGAHLALLLSSGKGQNVAKADLEQVESWLSKAPQGLEKAEARVKQLAKGASISPAVAKDVESWLGTPG